MPQRRTDLFWLTVPVRTVCGWQKDVAEEGCSMDGCQEAEIKLEGGKERRRKGAEKEKEK